MKYAREYASLQVSLAVTLQGIEAALDKAVTPEGAIKNHEYVLYDLLVKSGNDVEHFAKDYDYLVLYLVLFFLSLFLQ